MATKKPGAKRASSRRAPLRATAWGAAGIGVGLAALWYGKAILQGGRALLGLGDAAPGRDGSGVDGHAAAFRAGQTDPENLDQVRDAGPAAMRDATRRDWDEVDQASDESFPASDPPPVSPGIG